MNRFQRQALHRLLTSAAHRRDLADEIALLSPLLEPRPRRPKAIMPRHDQLPIPLRQAAAA